MTAFKTSKTLLTLATVAVLAGCASSPRSTGESTPAAPTPVTAEQRIAPPVVVPKAAARKVVLAMTGPRNVVEAKDWAEFQREWRETFAEHAKESGVQFSFVDKQPQPGTDDGTLLLVNVNDYRIVGIGARIFFGVMTGNAFIDAKVRYTSLRDGKVFGEQQFNTSSSAWGGVFAKVTPQQVDAIASNVFQDLRDAK
jgi:hypothetical protein